jgi:hypothetical protein
MSDSSLSDVAALSDLSGDESVSVAAESVDLEGIVLDLSADERDEQEEEEEEDGEVDSNGGEQEDQSEEDNVPGAAPPVVAGPAGPPAPAGVKTRRHSFDLFVKKKAIEEYEGGQVCRAPFAWPCFFFAL